MTLRQSAASATRAASRLCWPSVVLAAVGVTLVSAPALADETCQSPYMAKITGEEEYVYIWTLGMEGLGDGSDKLVTVDLRSGSPTFGQVIDVDSVGGRNEAHHGGLTDDRRIYWVSGLDSNKMFLFDIAGNPANPTLVKTIDDFEEKSGGVVGPHGAYALPGRVLISGLSNSTDKTGRSALVEYTNDGEYIATHWMPTRENPQGAANAEKADGYSYDARVLPRRNVMLSSSFTGWSNY
ncbi:MAG: selenium-binding protein SBP56-related protein, partial [Kiloniellaceae bacterium]